MKKQTKNILFWSLMFGVLLIIMHGMVSANLGTFKSSNCVSIVAPLNATAVNITNINYPNGTMAASNLVMTKSNNLFNYSFCNTSALGDYTYGFCDDSGNCYSNYFTITPGGFGISTSESLIYILILLAMIGSFIFIISKAVTSDSLGWQIGYSLVGWLILLVSAFMCYLLSLDFLYSIPFISTILNYVWLIMAILTPFVFLFAILGLLISNARELESKRKNRFDR